ncbi:MAG TPA: excinuclease ABC subunit UvrC [Clostridiales bacterium]|nr:excinuclease ABC subunit UvrC [Clostridiales bacterium]
MTKENLKRLRQKAMSLPKTPGVYLMKDAKGAVIYVGKAKALKNRVSSYFGSQEGLYVKVAKMVENVADFDYILTDSEFEALVLECSLIKQHMPKYNILLKDDKGYHYIRISREAWPTIRAVKQKTDDDAEYIGPYISSFAVTKPVDDALKIFKLPQCNKSFPADYKKSRPCLNYFINQCAAPCAGKMTHEQYLEATEEAIAFLKGGSAKAVSGLRERMEEAAENLEFEKAARLRDTIKAIEKMNEKQKVVNAGTGEQDVFALVQGSAAADSRTAKKACLAVLRFARGSLFDSEHFIIENPENLPEARHELLRSFYSMRDTVPQSILIDGEVEDKELIEEWLGSRVGRKVKISVPQKGRPQKLMEMCRANAAEKLAYSIGGAGKETAALDELARLLGLSSPPEYIEAYDISHTAGADNVAGMVVFKNGLPYKSAYKRFAIKGFQGQDDYASLAEVLTRRFNRYLEEKDTQTGFGRLPDLILIDGGLGQVNAVLPVLQSFGLDIPTFGMVKDSSHKTRAIAHGGGEIALSSKRSAFSLVSNIQNEVHRFAVDYHRKKHKSRSLSQTLTQIPGVGQARAKALLTHFRTMKALQAADVEDLAKVNGISPKLAQTVYDALRSDS